MAGPLEVSRKKGSIEGIHAKPITEGLERWFSG